MLRFAVIGVFMLSLFVGRVCPMLPKENHENIKVDIVANNTNNTNNNLNDTINISTTSASKIVTTTVKPVEIKKDVENVTDVKVSTSTKSPSTNTTTPPVVRVPLTKVEKSMKHAKQNCTSSMEQDDMLECNVTPHDDDDLIEQNVSTNSTEPTVTSTTVASNKTEKKVEPQKSIPSSKKDMENDKKNSTTVAANATEATSQVSYDVVSTETNHSLNINNSDIVSTDTKHNANVSDVSIDSTSPLLVNKANGSAGSEDLIAAVKSANPTTNRKRMSSGLIALVIAISFAMAIALVYAGMIIWRRYVEYKYGHRELLVNELEFDTNDLRHFEL